MNINQQKKDWKEIIKGSPMSSWVATIFANLIFGGAAVILIAIISLVIWFIISIWINIAHLLF